ncbi:glycosyltransferase [Maribacter sp. 1_MG-2023]|uniref:glycosyltransferase n=1 Tax=Maribacter sp. 1_MG-2023 TaxID=3062677 RepID=UPI0026E19CC2|nr:glycosyltransferase [Maribacter sp. 1_MG-2023]MDO6472184.1 glycosyltransferase [Maribacter sp. 1_MG-2023]
MSKKKPIVLFLNNIAPLYRQNVWTKYLESEKMDLNFFFGKESSSGIKTINFDEHKLKPHAHKINILKNIYIKQYLVWQNFNIFNWIHKKPQTIILLGEFNILSNWIITLIAKTNNIEIVSKGHGMYGNETGLKLFARKAFLKICDKHLVYEKHGKSILSNNGIDLDSIHILFNSLDYEKQKKYRELVPTLNKSKILHFFDKPELPTLIFIGRLTKVKKLELVIDAIKLIQENTPINFLVVGDGNEKNNLEELAYKNLNSDCYHFYGESYDEAVNNNLIAVSDLCVSPGNVGLTAIHSLSYGTPVCTHSNLMEQMPEAEAILDGVNGILFKQNNVESLKDAISLWINKTHDRQEVRENCYKVIDEYYNPNYQKKVIENLIEGNKPLI